MNLTKTQITEIASLIGLPYASLMAFISVESGGAGFINGKIVIQFEPHWFSKFLLKKGIKHTFSQSIENGKKVYVVKAGDVVFTNGVEGQEGEWEAFNKAFKIDPQAAMLSTSIGLMQIMGFHYIALGFKDVGEMWDSFKKGEYEQILGGAKFIKSHAKLYEAIKAKDWAKVAYYYNGANYRVNSYDIKLKKAYEKYSK